MIGDQPDGSFSEEEIRRLEAEGIIEIHEPGTPEWEAHARAIAERSAKRWIATPRHWRTRSSGPASTPRAGGISPRPPRRPRQAGLARVPTSASSSPTSNGLPR
jgi:hypothetical protein